MEFSICPVCGLDLVSKTGRRGRPAQYHPLCRKVDQLLSWLQDILISLPLTSLSKNKLRGRIFSLANLLNDKKTTVSNNSQIPLIKK